MSRMSWAMWMIAIPPVVQPPDDRKDPLSGCRVEIGRRLVEGDVAGIHGQDPGNGEEALLAAGKGVWDALLESRHAYRGKAFVDAPADLRRGQGEVFRAEGHVLLHGHPDDLAVGVLEDHSHPSPDLPDFGGVRRLHSVHQNPPHRGKEQGVQVLDEGRLSAAVRTDEGRVGPFGEGHAEARKDIGPFPVIAADHILHEDHGSLTPMRSRSFRAMRAVMTILIPSPIRKGRAPTARAFRGERRATRESWRTPRV